MKYLIYMARIYHPCGFLKNLFDKNIFKNIAQGMKLINSSLNIHKFTVEEKSQFVTVVCN
jgi:hypothetical protein